MSLKLKVVLGLAAALLGTSIGAAPACGETGGHFKSEVTHTELRGLDEVGQGMKLVVGFYEISCQNTLYHGTTASVQVTEVTITPVYENCSSGKSTVHIAMNGCHYLLTFGSKPAKDNTSHLVCPAGKQVTVTITQAPTNCVIHIGPHTPKGGVVYVPSGSPGKSHELTAKVTLEAIDLSATGGFFVCGAPEGTSQTATLTGSARILGFDTEGSQVGITTNEAAEFHAEISHPLLTGTQSTANEFTFGIALGSVKCTSATFDGTATTQTISQVTLKPTYFGCGGIGEREITTHMNGCAYVVEVADEAGSSGYVTIECPAGKAIETTVDKFPEGCTITIGAQTAKGSVDYKEEGAGSSRDLLLTWTLEGLTYTKDGCESSGVATNGTYTGSVTLKAEDTSGNQKGLWIE